MTNHDIVLIAGFWLPNTVWDPVVAELTKLGHHPVVPSIPGADDGSTSATLEDRLSAVLTAVDGADHPIVVGHSAASTLAWLAADRRPDAVASTVLIGGFPTSDGGSYADFFPVVDGVMAFPGWEPFEGPDADDLDEEARRAVESIAVAVPQGVSQASVHLTDARRYDVPTTLICPEFGPADAKGWVDSGDVPELAQAKSVAYVDIDSGHWPMITKPTELAALLAEIAQKD